MLYYLNMQTVCLKKEIYLLDKGVKECTVYADGKQGKGWDWDLTWCRGSGEAGVRSSCPSQWPALCIASLKVTKLFSQAVSERLAGVRFTNRWLSNENDKKC